MDPTQQPQGNPGMDPNVQAALARRGLGASGGQGALTQTSPGAAMANPTPPPMNPSQMTQASAPQGAPTGDTPKQPKFEATNAHEMVLSALVEELKNNNSLEKEKLKMASQPTPQPPAPAAPAMGGGGYGYQKPMGGGGDTTWSSSWNQPMARSQMQSNYQSGMGKDYSGLHNYGQ